MKLISNAELEEKLHRPNPKFYIVDVRESEEYEAGHIPNALLIPWHSIEDEINGLPHDKELILYCLTGIRAKKAAHFLEKLGFSNISVCVPGWEEWERNRRI